MSDATIPAVVQDAQRYDWREELDMATDYGMSLAAAARVAAYIERLETALTAHQSGEYAAVKDMQCLATIAREAEAGRDEWINRCHESEERALKAEAMCGWLAGELYDEDYLGLYTRAARTSENEPYTPSDRVADIATIVATARAAVEQEEAE